MLHHLDPAPAQEDQSKVDKAYQAWQSCKGFNQDRPDSVVSAGVPPESSIRDTVAGVTGPRFLEKRAPAAATLGLSHAFATVEAVAPPFGSICENGVLASVAQDGKILIGSKTIVTPGARSLAAGHDVLAQR